MSANASDCCGVRFARLVATGLILYFALVAGAVSAPLESPSTPSLIRDRYGAIIRGDMNQKKLALVFTADEFGESAESILNTLNKRNIRAAFFVTGKFVRTARWQRVLKQALTDGHYVGPHSDSHPLYASWEERNKSLVTERFFTDDLKKNLAELREFGALRQAQPILFIPPYEHYNSDQVEWSHKLGVTLFNFTPGSGSNRDYAREDDPHFVSSQKIFSDILAFERKDPHGLNGFVLLMHLGSGRKDPLHPWLGALCDEIRKRGYEFDRIDELLKLAATAKK